MEKKKLTRAFISVEFSSEVVKEVARVQDLLGKVKFTGCATIHAGGDVPRCHRGAIA